MEDTALRVSLCILAHCGLGGHRGLDQTRSNLDPFYWVDIKKDTKKFTRSCLQCNQTKGGRTIPRPFGNVITGTERNDVITFDFIYMEKLSKSCQHGFQYTLVVKDTMSHFVKLSACDRATTANAVKGILDWISTFGVPKVFLSDNGSHFANKVMKQLVQALGLEKHHFTIPHCPWGRGSVERVMRDLLAILRALLAELGAPSWQWPYFLHAVTDIMNSYKSRVLGGHCPREIMMDLPGTSVPRIVAHLPDVRSLVRSALKTADIKQHVAALHDSLVKLHGKVEQATGRRRRSNRKHRAKHSVLGNFTIGCYVLRAVVSSKIDSKLHIIWRGPYRVIELPCGQVCKLQHLLRTEEVVEVHATRIKYYADASMDVTEILLDNIEVQDSLKFHVKSIAGHRLQHEDNGGWQLLVHSIDSSPRPPLYGDDSESVRRADRPDPTPQ